MEICLSLLLTHLVLCQRLRTCLRCIEHVRTHVSHLSQRRTYHQTEFGCHTAGVKRNLVVIPRAWNGTLLSYRGRETEFGCHTAGVFDVFDVFLARYLATCLQSMLLPWTKADWMSLICLQSIWLLLSTLLGFLMTLGCVLNVLASVRFLQECRFTSIRLHAWILMILARSRVSSA